MKIGILTFCWTDHNYGQILQCYAMEKYLEYAGHEAFIIDYDKRNDYEKDKVLEKLKKAGNPKRLLHHIEKIIQSKIQNTKETNCNRDFDEFKKTYLKYSKSKYFSFYELRENPPDADIYIVGSDQVWNFLNSNLNKYENWINAYFLNFGDRKIKRMSYAASFGNSKVVVDKKYSEVIKKLLCDFKYISVREIEGIEICKSLGVSNVHLDPDPTLLLTQENYRQLYSQNEMKYYCECDKPFVFLYLVGNKCDFDFKMFMKWASEKGLNIKYVADAIRYDKYEKIYPTIPEWLWLIDHSSYVLTNSFHGTVFSIIFNKKFLNIPLSGDSEGMNSRVKSLFRLFNIKERFLYGENYKEIDKPYNYNVDSVFDRMGFSRIIDHS